MKLLLLIAIYATAWYGCSTMVHPKPAVNTLSSGYLAASQTEAIYSIAKHFPNETQLSIAIIQHGKATYYGVKRSNDTLFNTENKNNVFEIGSISKVFTASMLADEVTRARLRLDDTINKHFEYVFNNNLEFTFEELANHSAGLSRLPSNIKFIGLLNPDNPYKKYSEHKLDDYLKNSVSLEYTKGSKSEYSNLGFGLLSYTLRKQSGLSYEQLLSSKITAPLQLKNTTTNRESIQPMLIGGRNKSGKPTSNWDSGALIGAGGIYSTVEDLTLFAKAHFDSTQHALALTRRVTFKEDETNDVGLGWFIINRKNGDKWYWHNGRTGGYTSIMAMDVENMNGVILLSNLSAYHKQARNIDQLCFALMKTLY